MSAFSVFRASFDGGLRPQHRRKGRLAAAAIIVATVALLGGSLLTILHLSSNQLADMANAGPPRDVRQAAIETARNKSCAEQTWPFIEGRCLIDTNALKKAERAIPRQAQIRQASASHNVAMASRKKRARIKSPDAGTLVATRSRPTQIAAASTTGASPRNEETSQPAKPQNAVMAKPPAASVTAAPTPQRNDHAIAARRTQEQFRREAQRKVRLTREQREARAESRARREYARSASRMNDYNNYPSPYGGQQRGMFDGGFFSTIR